jgi:ribosome recycling factor
MDNQVYEQTKQQMEKSLKALGHELSKMRTGRASLSILDDVRVDYYGTMTPLNQVATLSLPDARTIAVQAWDNSAVAGIERALQKADLGLNPINDGKTIRLPIPPLNEERRKELVKTMRKHGEECKVGVRNARRDANEDLKKLKKDSEIAEDDERRGHDRVQKLTDDYIKKIEEALDHKEKDIMEV